MDNLSEQFAALKERVVTINDKADAAHRRLDDTKKLVREDLKEIKDDLKILQKQTITISNSIYKSKGIMIAIVAMAGILGTIAGNIIQLMLKLN